MVSLMSFNTQPPEGGWYVIEDVLYDLPVSTHSRPKAAVSFPHYPTIGYEFQHTAARRRLATDCKTNGESRCFNTQPPEGGCIVEVEHGE